VKLGDAELILNPSAAARGFAAAFFALGALFFARDVFFAGFLAAMLRSSRPSSL